MEKYEDKKNNLLMSINGKTIFKIDNNFFIDNTGIRTFTKESIDLINPLKINQELEYAKKYIKKCSRSEDGTNSYELLKDMYHFLVDKGYEEEDCVVSNGSFLVACYLVGVPVKIIANGNDFFVEVYLNKAPKEYVIKTSRDKTYFGLEIQEGNLVKQSDIKKLPFYEFWLESAKGSTCAIIDGEEYIYLSDWESFASLFIKTGKHRFQKRD